MERRGPSEALDRPLSVEQRVRLADHLTLVRSRIEAALERSHRPPGSAELLAVTKGVPAAVLRELPSLGQVDVAESRVQALALRPADLTGRLRFHLVGHLQTNKARRAVAGFQSFHALDSVRLADSVARQAQAAGRTWPVFVQVNVAGEAAKHGCTPAELPALLARVAGLPSLAVQGLMTLAPYREDPEECRWVFAALRSIAEGLRHDGLLPEHATGLSMGMSHDFEVAVEEGATVVRVGSALFDGLFAPEDAHG